MTGTISTRSATLERAQHNFTLLMTHVANLYCMGGSSSVSADEASELATSLAYTLGIIGASSEKAASILDVEDPIALWSNRLAALDTRVDAALSIWSEVVSTMPPIYNLALRDTLASLKELRRHYDTRFAAHVVPCGIDYQLSDPVNPSLLGIDFVEAWLSQLLKEALWIAQFDVDSCVAALERVCPDYRGLHVNLYDLLFPCVSELRPAKTL